MLSSVPAGAHHSGVIPEVTMEGPAHAVPLVARVEQISLRRATYVEVGPTTMMQHRPVRYIGLDVHKATISAAIAEESGAPTS